MVQDDSQDLGHNVAEPTPEAKARDEISRFKALVCASDESDSRGIRKLDSCYKFSIHKW